MDLALVIKGASLAVSIAQYIKLLQDDLGLELAKLADSELEAALRALNQAARSEREQQWLLREARGCFNKAISLETGIRLAAAHIGIALCHVNLGDVTNAEESLSTLSRVKIPPPTGLVMAGVVASKVPWPAAVNFVLPVLPLVPFVLVAKAFGPVAAAAFQRYQAEAEKLADLQANAKQLLKLPLTDALPGTPLTI